MAIIKRWLTEVVKSLQCLITSRGYNRLELRKKKNKIDHSKLNGSEIQAHSVSQFSLDTNSYMTQKQWSAVHESILQLADNLKKYASYSELQNQAFHKRQAMTPAEVMLMTLMYYQPLPLSSQHLLLDTGAFMMLLYTQKILSQFYWGPFSTIPKAEVWLQPWTGCADEVCQVFLHRESNHLCFIWKMPAGLSEGELLKNISIALELCAYIPQLCYA